MVKVIRDSKGRETLVRTEEDERSSFSFMKVVDRVDSLPENYSVLPEFKENIYYLTSHNGHHIGFITKYVLSELETLTGEDFNHTFKKNEIEHEIRFRSNDFKTRNDQLDKIGRTMYKKSSTNEVKGWRNEKYSIWVDKSPYILMERAMSGIFGIITYGVHINGYVHENENDSIKFWIPRRSATKQTWPLMLDNIVAGGIGYPHGIFDTVLKESIEEANLSEEIIRDNIRPAGVLSYFHYNGDYKKNRFNCESEFIVGEVEFVYDMKLNKDIIPLPNDGEVDSFNLLSLEETITAIERDQFKPNCALVMTDFLIRHGYITPENEPFYLEIVNKMHRRLPFPTRC